MQLERSFGIALSWLTADLLSPRLAQSRLAYEDTDDEKVAHKRADASYFMVCIPKDLPTPLTLSRDLFTASLFTRSSC